MQFVLKKEDLGNFVQAVSKKHEFIAPVKNEDYKNNSETSFKVIKNHEEIFLDKLSYFPVKGFFFKDDEILFSFSNGKIKPAEIQVSDKVLFGLRKCDLNAIYRQDIVFMEENPDPYYKTRRDNSILIGLHCNEGMEDKYCFCNSLELIEFHDLMFYDKGDFYAIEVGTKKGEKFIKSFKKFFEAKETLNEEDKKIVNHISLNNLEIKNLYNHDDWKKGADECISCGACNFLCPTCHCFSVEDDIEMNLVDGKRVRKQASCQLKSFTRVAGDHIFRDSKLARFKHRIYHQIQYFKDRHNIIMCTGCGRCVRGCPAKIDWINIINEIK